MNMKLSVKKLSMVVALLLSVAIAPAAWSATFTLIEDLTGTVYECEPGISTRIQIEIEGTMYSVYGLGPASYWEDQGVAFPDVGDPISILVGEITFSDDTSKLVAMSVDVNNDGIYEIDLRDSATGVPLWRGSKAALTQTKGNR
jgi:hypothetical protein